MNIRMPKINKEGIVSDELMNKTYDPGLTKRNTFICSQWGRQHQVLNNRTSGIKLRIIGGDGKKSYNVVARAKKDTPV